MTHTEVGRRTFHQALRDIAVPYALAADWPDSGPRRIVEEFAEVLQRTLQLSFIYLRLKDSTEDRHVEATRWRSGMWRDCGGQLRRTLSNRRRSNSPQPRRQLRRAYRVGQQASKRA